MLTKKEPSILLVEDDHVQQMVMRVLCEKFGFTAFIVSSGEEAIRAIKTCRYDAILMDWKLPGMSGFDTTGAIREIENESGRHTPIIAVTAHAMVGDREQCIEAGMDDYLSKPFQAEQLIAIVKKWASPNSDSSRVR